MTGQRILSPTELERTRCSRRYPRPTQFDYLHLRRLLLDIRAALMRLEHPVRDVLDIYCGSRPYEDLLPAEAHVVGLDVPGNPYGVADVESDEFLPFASESFDLVTCYEAFYYVPDPAHGVEEIRRVLRPGGAALITVPLVWEYDRRILEHRFTGPALAALFADWEGVEVVENGGPVVVWATLTGLMLERLRARIPAAHGLGDLVRSGFTPALLVMNAVTSLLNRVEERREHGPVTLPMNLLVIARRPADA